jgi:hypothetical protein
MGAARIAAYASPMFVALFVAERADLSTGLWDVVRFLVAVAIAVVWLAVVWRNAVRIGRFTELTMEQTPPVNPGGCVSTSGDRRRRADDTRTDHVRDVRGSLAITSAKHPCANQQANDKGIIKRLSAIDLAPTDRLGARPIGLVTLDDLQVAFGKLASLSGSTWNKYRHAVLVMQRWGSRTDTSASRGLRI